MGAVAVACKAAPEAMTRVASGQVAFTALDFATGMPLVKAGRLKALAVTPGKRTSLAPQLPTVGEASALPDFGVTAWMGVFGPAGMPAAITERLSGEIAKILPTTALQERFVAMGVEPAPAGPQEFQTFVKDRPGVWERQIGIAGMKPE